MLRLLMQRTNATETPDNWTIEATTKEGNNKRKEVERISRREIAMLKRWAWPQAASYPEPDCNADTVNDYPK